jgi:polysaccharide deacetylase 2 family uncharacterized protein YibQ
LLLPGISAGAQTPAEAKKSQPAAEEAGNFFDKANTLATVQSRLKNAPHFARNKDIPEQASLIISYFLETIKYLPKVSHGRRRLLLYRLFQLLHRLFVFRGHSRRVSAENTAETAAALPA